MPLSEVIENSHVAEELRQLIHPQWGVEKWLVAGLEKLSAAERQAVIAQVAAVFDQGLPFTLSHDRNLYLYFFSLMAQLQVVSLLQPLLLLEQPTSAALKQKLHGQLIDDLCHLMILTKLTFMLAAPYQQPPKLCIELETLYQSIKRQPCIKMQLALTNLIGKGLLTEGLQVLLSNNILTALLEPMLKVKQQHQQWQTMLYDEIGLADGHLLQDALNELETLMTKAALSSPHYGVVSGVILGPMVTYELLTAINERHVRQLEQWHIQPGDKWVLAFQLSLEASRDIKAQHDNVNEQILAAFREVEPSPRQKLQSAQFNSSGDPVMVSQFNIDISDFGLFDEQYPRQILTMLMLQAASQVLAESETFRQFLSFNKMHQSHNAYTAIIDKLPDDDEHLSTVFFRDSHQLSVKDLLGKVERSKQMMRFCFDKRQQLEQEYAALKQCLDDDFDELAHHVHPFPMAGNHGLYLCDIGQYGYTHAKLPLPTAGGLFMALLAPERKQVWCRVTKAFVIQDIQPVSISADVRVFDGQLAIADKLNNAFKQMLAKFTSQVEDYGNEQLPESDELVEAVTNQLLEKQHGLKGRKLLSYLKSKQIYLKQAHNIIGNDIIEQAKKLYQYDRLDNLAHQMLLDYFGFDAEQASNNEAFVKLVDKLIDENPEVAYRALYAMQSIWYDYLDVEATFKSVYQKIADSRLATLNKLWV